jgi:hypothetical protein
MESPSTVRQTSSLATRLTSAHAITRRCGNNTTAARQATFLAMRLAMYTRRLNHTETPRQLSWADCAQHQTQHEAVTPTDRSTIPQGYIDRTVTYQRPQTLPARANTSARVNAPTIRITFTRYTRDACCSIYHATTAMMLSGLDHPGSKTPNTFQDHTRSHCNTRIDCLRTVQ